MVLLSVLSTLNERNFSVPFDKGTASVWVGPSESNDIGHMIVLQSVGKTMLRELYGKRKGRGDIFLKISLDFHAGIPMPVHSMTVIVLPSPSLATLTLSDQPQW